MLIGNKSDLVEERVVSFLAATELAKKYEYDYVEVSAKTGENVKFLFEVLSKRMIKKQELYDNKKEFKTPNKKKGGSEANDCKSPYSRSENGTVRLGKDGSVKKKSCC